jgi:transcriptional regulator with XRE-family HTH domain
VASLDQGIGRRLRGKRLALGLSQGDVAISLGVTPDTIEGYERATIRVPPEHLIKLAELFGVSVSYFFPGPSGSAK